MTSDIIIVGGGVAGLSAAMYLRKNAVNVSVIHDAQHPSYLQQVQAISIFPGFSGTGSQLLDHLRQEAAGAQFINAVVRNFQNDAQRSITLSNGDSMQAKAVILAMGAHRKAHPIDGEHAWLGRGVYMCSKANISFAQSKRVIVVGKSAWAAEAALLLAQEANHVTFVIPATKLDIGEKMQKDLQAQGKIELMTTTSVKAILGSDKVERVVVVSMGNEKTLPCEAVFSCLTEYTPHPSLQKFVRQTEQGAVMVDERFCTSQSGFFACGDLLCNSPQLPFISSAQGLACATHAQEFLRS